MPLSNLDPPGAKKMIFISLGEIWSLFTRILNLRHSLGVSLGWIPPGDVLLLNEIIGVFAGFAII